MEQPTVFISYSHEDEEDKKQLVSHLEVLQQEGLLEVWVDDRIKGGADWAADINKAIGRAKVAILLITRNFLTSKFIREVEVQQVLELQEQKGLVVYPIIGRACAWHDVTWLARLHVRPKNGEPVWKRSRAQADVPLAELAAEIYKIIREAQEEVRRGLVHIHNWGVPEANILAAESLNWNQPGLFEDGSPRRVPGPEVWQESLLPQLKALPAKLGPIERVRLVGRCALSTGFAFGQVFKAINRCTLEVAQFSPKLEWWSSEAQLPEGKRAPHLTVQTFQGNPAAADGVVIINALTQVPLTKIVADVGTYFNDVSGFSQLLTGQSTPQAVKSVLVMESGNVAEDRFLAGWEAAALAGSSRRILIDFITQSQPQKLHLFLATPLGLAVFLGHRWNRVGKWVQCYEWTGDDRVYAPSCEFLLG